MRRFLHLSLLALLGAAPLSARAAVAPGAGVVVGIQPTRVADLVLLDHGFNAGLRQGMVCHITRGASEIAEVLIVDLRPARSAALILSLGAGQSIRTGDVAAIKVLKT